MLVLLICVVMFHLSARAAQRALHTGKRSLFACVLLLLLVALLRLLVALLNRLLTLLLGLSCAVRCMMYADVRSPTSPAYR